MSRWVRPVVAPITQVFGQLPNELPGVVGVGGHPGTDYGCPDGTPIVAASDGVVIFNGPARGFGDHALSIYHPADNVTTTYGHMMAAYPLDGAQVFAGERVGLSDSEGDVTGPHLHLELRPGRVSFGYYSGGPGSNVDPEAWLVAHSAQPPGSGLVSNMPTINANGPLNMAAPIIRTAQALLGARGAWISPSNVSHPIFSTAIRWFQQEAGLVVDDIIGPTTWERLVEPLNGK